MGAKAAVGDGRLEPLLVIGGVDREEIGQGVQRQLVPQVLLQAGADEGVPDHRGVLGAGAFLHREGQRLHHRLGDGGVARVVPGEFPLLIGREVAVQQLQEGPVVVQLAVEVGRAVGGMVVPVVVVLQRLPGHVRDVLRHAALAVAHQRAGEGGAHQVQGRHPLQVGQAQHLGIHGALDGQRVVGVLQPVAPGLGAEDVLVLHDDGVEAGVGVELRQLQKLRLGQAGDGIRREPLLRHGVQEGVVGLVVQIVVHLLAGVLLRALNRGVLEHVGQAGVVNGLGEKGQVEGPIRVVVGNVVQLRPGLLMGKAHDGGVHQRVVPGLDDLEAVDHVPHLGQRRCVTRFCQRRGQKPQRQREDYQQRNCPFHMPLLSLRSVEKTIRHWHYITFHAARIAFSY